NKFKVVLKEAVCSSTNTAQIVDACPSGRPFCCRIEETRQHGRHSVGWLERRCWQSCGRRNFISPCALLQPDSHIVIVSAFSWLACEPH
uniref:Uncharacterized protein n=1 Tax=Parascaris univalens TaxID=6257 RepID=A0A915A1U4_PARUN